MILGENTFVSRIPILDIKSRVQAYELRFFTQQRGDGAGAVEEVRFGSSTADLFESVAPRKLVGGKKAVVALDPDGSPLIPPTWHNHLVLQLPLSAAAAGRAPLSDRPRWASPSLCISDITPLNGSAPSLPTPCYAKIDIEQHPDLELSGTVKALKVQPVAVIAAPVDTWEDFERCTRAGADFVCGEYFTRPVLSGQKSVSPSQTLLMELFRQTNQNGDIRDVEAIFKKNPDLAFGLMNLVHSAYYRVSEHVASIRQAIALLGYENLHKWVALMLFTIGQSDPASSPLFEKALVRAKTMELAAMKLRRKGLSSSAYIAGIFSLIPALFDVAIEEIVGKANFIDEIKEALLERSGVIGELLTAAEILEKGGYESLPQLKESHLHPFDFFRAHTQAILESSGSMEEQMDIEPAGGRAEAPVENLRGQSAPSAAADGSRGGRRSWFGRFFSIFGIAMKRGSVA